MKKIVFVFSFLLLAANLFSQDTIVFRNNKTLLAKVLEVSSLEVKYKRFEFIDGPLYTEQKTNIQFIKYSNGVKEEFKLEDAVVNKNPNPVPLNIAFYKLDQQGPRLIYQGITLHEKDLNALLLASNDKALINITLKSMKANRLRHIGIIAMPLALLALGSYAIGGALQSDDYTPFAEGCAVLSIPFALTGMINNGKHLAYKKDAIELYNMKY